MWILKNLVYLSFLCIVSSCADQKLALSKEPNYSNKIRLDGLYYSVYRDTSEIYYILLRKWCFFLLWMAIQS